MKKYFSSKEVLIEKLLIPALLILITAWVGLYIGRDLQARKFKKERLFELKMETIKEGSKTSIDLNIRAKQLIRLLDSNERNISSWSLTPETKENRRTRRTVLNYDFSNEKREILTLEQKITELRGYAKVCDIDNVIMNSLDDCIASISNLDKCLSNNSDYRCYQEHEKELYSTFDRLETSFAQVLILMVEQEEVK